MQYCGAAPVPKFVPYSESLLSTCGNDSYRYCELYLQMAHPLPPAESADGLPMPAELGYSANHMWLDVAEDGVCHVGIDSFLSRALGEVERISFVWKEGHRRPTAVITAAGVDMEITLPFPMQLTKCNLYLRADPKRLTSDPYSGGWLFEGVPDTGTLESLVRGEQALEWMDGEVKRISEFLQQLPGPNGPTAADGGMFSAGLPRYIEREQMLALFHEFFSPYASRK
jgi:glycine cleavage system H protein